MPSLIFPHQLFADTDIWQDECYLIEEDLFFTQYPFHQQKLVLHRASMQAYAERLRNVGKTVHYIESADVRSDCRVLVESLAGAKIHVLDVVDDWLRQRLKSACLSHGVTVKLSATPMFLQKYAVYRDFFTRKRFFHHDFYVQARHRENILLDSQGKPLGRQWSFDAENRKKYPRKQTPPSVNFPTLTNEYRQAIDYVNAHFPDHYGETNADFVYPSTHEQAQVWLDEFLRVRFSEFGVYEDAIVADASILHHSVLTPMLNVGLLTPQQIVDTTLDFAKNNDIPVNSLEGFIRQIIGWREFMYGLYESVGRQQRTRNFWGFSRPIPDSFYTGDTGIVPIDTTIKKVLKTGYCHHIERLMILGNFMLLCEFDPDAVYQWFMELFIDAYDWVMVPNIYGMSQFADGGLMATKPYISGSNYLAKMSDFTIKSKGEPVEWAATWDGLFWRFMHVHRDFFAANPRIGMLLKMWDKMDTEKQQTHITNAEHFLRGLDERKIKCR